MSTLHHQRQKPASGQESSGGKHLPSASPPLLTQGPYMLSLSPATTVTPVTLSSCSTPSIESVRVISWPVGCFITGDEMSSSQLSPWVEGDSWTSDSSVSSQFLEADTPERLYEHATSPKQDVIKSDDHNAINGLGVYMSLDTVPLLNNPDSNIIPVYMTKQSCLKSDAWMSYPTDSNGEIDQLLLESARSKAPIYHTPLLQPVRCEPTTELSTSEYYHGDPETAPKKKRAIIKELDVNELLFRKEKNRLRSKAYRLRRKMQFESMKKEVTEARREIQAVQKHTIQTYLCTQ